MVLFFKGCQFTVDFSSKHFSYKRKQEIRRNITGHGGTISYILNYKTKFFASENTEILESYKGRQALKLGIPIVSLSFIDDCTKQQKLLDSDEYLVVGKSTAKQFSSGIIKANVKKSSDSKPKSLKPLSATNLKATRVYLYDQDNETSPFFPTDDYEIIKYAWFKKTDKSGLCCFVAIELHVSTSPQVENNERVRPTHRIFAHHGVIDKGVIIDSQQGSKKKCRFASDSDTSEQLYSLLCAHHQSDYRQQFTVFPSGVGSPKMISNNLSSQISNKDSISSSVKSLVHSIWSDAVGELSSLLSVPVERLRLEDIDKAEGILQAIREILDKNEPSHENLKKFSDEFYSLILHNEKQKMEIGTKRVIAEKQDLCQLIKDMVNVSEATNFSARSSDEAKYKALGCRLESLSTSSDEYMNIVNRVQSTSVSDIKVQNVFRCQRPVEAANFQSHHGNVRQLFHSSKAQNFLGIISRGLLLPKVVVSDYGGKRSDAGSLGNGIYFGIDASTSIKYSSPGQSRGSRLMLICDVALGNIKDYTEFAQDLENAPEGYQSCHGVQNQPGVCSTQFADDEYVVYSVNQQKICYLVEFTLPGDDVMNDIREDVTGNEGENILCEPTTAISLDEKIESSDEEDSPNILISDIENQEDPLTKVKPGLRFGGDVLVPLQSVHIRAKLLDMCAKVVVMQVYNNSSAKPIEAKYVFPLDDMAAVCGFEAFINGKHIVGEVKEKEQAHKEYKKAISEGHGAYLMDEETPDVFTVSVGNIPPEATVLIKITYVAELPVEDENIMFNLPGSLAPWSRDEALKDSTQVVLQSVQVDNDNACDLSVHIAIEMPFDIRTLNCSTHDVKMKKTATKAVIQLNEGQNLDTGFQLLIGLAEIHVPRMWVERHPENSDSQACMLSFYPEFEAEHMTNIEYVFLLDLSCSMKGTPLDNAKKILLLTLNKLPENCRFNIVTFGSQWLELFPTSIVKNENSLKDAAAFVKRCKSDMGATDLWKILKALSLLPVRTDVDVRNVCILSDGHVTEEELSLKLVSSTQQQSRVFTFGVGSSANRYFLRTLAKIGAGASEYFDSKVKSKWQRKVETLLTKSQQPVLTSVSVAWQQFDDDAPIPIQAPSQIVSLFNGSRQVVYGFVPYCTQATLKAVINGKEISTMVSTSELSITTGLTLHQLTARALINDWEEGLLAPDHLHHQAVKVSRKDYIIKISIDYSVTSKFTSFVAIEKREEGETFDAKTSPNIKEILDGEDVDFLGYIGWEEESNEEIEEEFNQDLADMVLESGRVQSTSSDELSTDDDEFSNSDSVSISESLVGGGGRETLSLSDTEEVYGLEVEDLVEHCGDKNDDWDSDSDSDLDDGDVSALKSRRLKMFGGGDSREVMSLGLPNRGNVFTTNTAPVFPSAALSTSFSHYPSALFQQQQQPIMGRSMHGQQPQSFGSSAFGSSALAESQPQTKTGLLKKFGLFNKESSALPREQPTTFNTEGARGFSFCMANDEDEKERTDEKEPDFFSLGQKQDMSLEMSKPKSALKGSLFGTKLQPVEEQFVELEASSSNERTLIRKGCAPSTLRAFSSRSSSAESVIYSPPPRGSIIPPPPLLPRSHIAPSVPLRRSRSKGVEVVERSEKDRSTFTIGQPSPKSPPKRLVRSERELPPMAESRSFGRKSAIVQSLATSKMLLKSSIEELEPLGEEPDQMFEVLPKKKKKEKSLRENEEERHVEHKQTERSTAIVTKDLINCVFRLQNEDGSWTLPDFLLDKYIGIQTDAIERLLLESGAKSLGTRTFNILCKMLATLLVLAYLRHKSPSIFAFQLIPPFRETMISEESDTEWHAKTNKALTWLKTADKLVPCVCTRLQLGNSWEEVIPKLLRLT